MPAGRNVGNFNHRWIEVDNLLHRNNCGVVGIRIVKAKELPTMIVTVVTHVKNWVSMKHD